MNNILYITIVLFLALLFYSQCISLKKHERFMNGIIINELDVYLINMDKNKDRLDNFIDQYLLSDLNIKAFKRFSAIDGNLLDLTEYVTQQAAFEMKESAEQGFRTKHYQLTRGAVGCYLSHLYLYKLIKDSNKPYALVFEDDVIIDKNILAKMNKAIIKVPNNWDILLLGCFCIVCNKFREYYDTERFFLMHAYIIKKEAAALIYSHLDNQPIKQQIDSELSDMVAQGKLKIFCLRESYAKQGEKFQTTIQMPLKVLPGVNPYEAVK